MVPAIAGGLLLLAGRSVAGGVLLGLGCGLVVAACVAPWVGRALHRGLTAAALGVGRGLTWTLLGLFHLLLLVPGRVVLLAAGRDPLQRRFPGGRDSYWQPCRPRESEGLERQF